MSSTVLAVRRSRPVTLPIPGPTGRWPAGNLADYEQDRLGFLLRTRDQWGGLVRFAADTTIVHDPEAACAVLEEQSGFGVTENFLQEPVGLEQDQRLTELRRLLNPGLRRTQVVAVGRQVGAEVAARLVASSRSGWVDPVGALDDLVVDALATHYFGPQAGSYADDTGALLDGLALIIGNPFALPASWGGPTRRRIRAAHARIQARVVGDLRRAEGVSPELVGTARGLGWDAGRTADALIGALLAAHRVPVAALGWTLRELADRPDLQRSVCDDEGLARAVVLESLRLHPATWLLTRRTSRDVEVAGRRFGAGHHLMISPWVIHRDPTVFADPQRFAPERWLAGGAPPRAYLPFGRGLHRCPGNELALAVLVSSVVEVCAAGPLVRLPQHVVADPRTTLTPRGLRLRLG